MPTQRPHSPDSVGAVARAAQDAAGSDSDDSVTSRPLSSLPTPGSRPGGLRPGHQGGPSPSVSGASHPSPLGAHAGGNSWARARVPGDAPVARVDEAGEDDDRESRGSFDGRDAPVYRGAAGRGDGSGSEAGDQPGDTPATAHLLDHKAKRGRRGGEGGTGLSPVERVEAAVPAVAGPGPRARGPQQELPPELRAQAEASGGSSGEEVTSPAHAAPTGGAQQRTHMRSAWELQVVESVDTTQRTVRPVSNTISCWLRIGCWSIAARNAWSSAELRCTLRSSAGLKAAARRVRVRIRFGRVPC